MGRANNLSEREKGKIYAYMNLKLSKREISRRIRRSVHCISTFIKEGHKYGKNYKGKKRILSPCSCRRLRFCASNSTAGAGKLKATLNLSASCSTIKRRLREMDLVRKRMKSKLPLTVLHKNARLEFCRTYMQQEWSKVWFSDEKRWCLDGPDCFSYYWHDLRKEPLLRSKRQGGGGSFMIWGGMCVMKTTSLCFINDTLDSKKYQEMLLTHLLPFRQADEIFMQDNATVHASKSTMNWIQSHNIPTMKWPSRSPDLNPIENVWGIMARRIYASGKQYSNTKELKEAIMKCWRSLRAEDLTPLANSMCDRVYDCIKRRGMHVDY